MKVTNYSFPKNTLQLQYNVIPFLSFLPKDIDECSLSKDNCHPNATCVNIGGSYLCTCGTGVVCNGKEDDTKLS